MSTSWDPSLLKDKEGRLKVLVVYKKTRLELWNEDEKPEQTVQEAHDFHQHCVVHVQSILEKYKVNFLSCYRGELPASFVNDRMVVTIGGDGTFLDTSRSLCRGPMLGVNSDAERSVGSLCAANIHNFEELFRSILSGQFLPRPLMRIQLRLNGETLPFLACNEVLVAHSNPAAMSRYVLEMNGCKEEQKSSGVWVSTPMGSTGAMVSAGGKVQPIEDNRLQVKVREPYFSSEKKANHFWSFVPFSAKVRIESHMQMGAIFIDGYHCMVPFHAGAQLEITGQGEPLLAWVTEEMEKRRQAIGHVRQNFHDEERSKPC